MNDLRPFRGPSRAVLFLLAAACATLPLTAWAGGWTQPRGGHYLKVWTRALIGSMAYLANGDTADVESYQDVNLNVYFEYGILDDWTVIAFGNPIGYAHVEDESTAYSGGLVVGVRRAILGGEGPAALGLEVRYGYAPAAGNDVLFVGEVDGQSYAFLPTVETHRVDGELQFGYALPWGWLSLAAGGRLLSAVSLDPVITGLIQVGIVFDGGLTLSIYATAYQPVGEVKTTNVLGAGQTRYVGAGLDLSYWFGDHWAISAGFAGAALVESNAATPSLTLGFEHR